MTRFLLHFVRNLRQFPILHIRKWYSNMFEMCLVIFISFVRNVSVCYGKRLVVIFKIDQFLSKFWSNFGSSEVVHIHTF